MAQGVLPHFADAEQAVLGGVLLQPNLFSVVSEQVKSDDFYKPAHRELFQTMAELESSGEAIDIVTLTARLKTKNLLDEAGGAAYVTSLLDRVPTTAHIEHHAKIIAEAALRRRIILAAQDIQAKGIEGSETVEDYLDFSEGLLFGVTAQRQKKSFSELKSILKSNIETIDRLYNKKEAITGIPSGFTEFDKMTSGLQPSDLIIIAARPSMGKTAFAMNIATQVGIRKQGAVLVFSLEMSKEQLGLRILATQSKIDSKRLRNGQLHEADWPKLIRATNQLSEAQIFIDENPNLSVLDLRSSCRRIATQCKPALILVDYLQLMRGTQARSENREKEISEISRGLKALAKELSVPVVALSQLNRGVDSRPDKRPMLSDLRESGAIEQDADVIVFIYRDEVYNKETDQKGTAEIIIGKQRNGPTGTVTLTWLDRYTSFENFATSAPGMSRPAGEVFTPQRPPQAEAPTDIEF